MSSDDAVEGVPGILCRVALTGSKGYGTFATRDIEAGEVVIAEAPAITTHDEQYLELFLRTYDRLKEDDRLKFLNLHPDPNSTYDAGRRAALDTIPETADRSDDAKNDIIKGLKITNANAFQIHISEGEGWSGVYLDASRINHSCDPNVDYVIDKASWVWTGRASRRIKKEDQIFISYIPYGMLREERQRELQESWGFQCDCEFCAISEDTYAARLEETLALAAGGGGVVAGAAGAEGDDGQQTDEMERRNAIYDRRIELLKQLEWKKPLFFTAENAAWFNWYHWTHKTDLEDLPRSVLAKRALDYSKIAMSAGRDGFGRDSEVLIGFKTVLRLVTRVPRYLINIAAINTIGDFPIFLSHPPLLRIPVLERLHLSPIPATTMAATDEGSMPFIKHLASSDRKARNSALDTLRTFLSATTATRSLTPLDNLKLWKGLFYSLWMCDRPIPQQNLCAELAALIDVLPDEAVVPWLEGFWAIMAREWTGIDVLRMEKFLLLVRRVFAAGLAWTSYGKAGAKGRKGRKVKEQAMLELLAAWPFDRTWDLSRVPVGLRLHAIDIWVDEAEKLGMLDQGEDEQSPETSHLLEGVRHLVEEQVKSTCKPLRARAKESLADERLPWKALEANTGDERIQSQGTSSDKDSWHGFDD